MPTMLTIECVFCGRLMGENDGMGCSGATSSICPECVVRYYPDYAEELLSVYPESPSGKAGKFRLA
ncbi:MAG TPA: hypothetical protein VFG19_05240 [Geobacteraceae bacterium]|nr:hypothetical protein [Geobacteraceae bacterium]